MKRRCPCDVVTEVGMIGFGLSVLIADHCFRPDGSDVLACPCCACLSFGAHVGVRRVVGSFLLDLELVGTSEYTTCRKVVHGASGCCSCCQFFSDRGLCGRLGGRTSHPWRHLCAPPANRADATRTS